MGCSGAKRARPCRLGYLKLKREDRPQAGLENHHVQSKKKYITLPFRSIFLQCFIVERRAKYSKHHVVISSFPQPIGLNINVYILSLKLQPKSIDLFIHIPVLYFTRLRLLYVLYTLMTER